MLTARGEAESRIEGLEIGADDYVGKPFEPRELSLRIASILKRARPARAAAGRVRALRRVRLPHRRAASSSAARRSSISPTASARCCALLAATPGRDRAAAGARRQRRNGGNGGAIGERAVDVQVNRLRRKIERDPANPLLVQTVRGVGYRLVATP